MKLVSFSCPVLLNHWTGH